MPIDRSMNKRLERIEAVDGELPLEVIYHGEGGYYYNDPYSMRHGGQPISDEELARLRAESRLIIVEYVKHNPDYPSDKLVEVIYDEDNNEPAEGG